MKTARMTTLVLLSVAALAPWSAVNAQSTQYKWRDAQGNVQYSDRPPPAGIPDKDILGQPKSGQKRSGSVALPPLSVVNSTAASSPASASAPKGSDPELEARKRKEKEQQEAKQKAAEEKLAHERQENCQRARSYLRSLDDGMRIARTKENGEREFLTDQQRAQEASRAKEGIEANCK